MARLRRKSSTGSLDDNTLSRKFEVDTDDAFKVKQLSNKVGFTSKHLLALLQKAYEDSVVIGFRPVYEFTKVKYYVFNGEGKGTDIKLKSADWGPIATLVPYDFGLSKKPDNEFFIYQQQVDKAIQEGDKFIASFGNRIAPGKNIDTLNDELSSKQILGKEVHQVEDESHQKHDLCCLARDGRAFLGQNGKPIYFYETTTENGITQRHYYKVDKNGKETYKPDSGLDAQYSAQGLSTKKVEVLVYRHYVIKDNQLINDHNIAIPDYDMLSIGYANKGKDPQKNYNIF